MGTGPDVAMNSAQLTLIKGDLRGIVIARTLPEATVANMKQNLAFAFVYNAIDVPLAAGVLYAFIGWLLSPMFAALAMSLSSVPVIGNALRLRGKDLRAKWTAARGLEAVAVAGCSAPTGPDGPGRLQVVSAQVDLEQMCRLPVILVVLIAMLWQSVAMARIGSTVNVLLDAGHAALHWQGESHHHHGDGSYHLDDSKESAQHVVTDHLSATLAMTTPSSQDFTRSGSAAHGGLHETRLPNPTLDGLLRPPRVRA
jgi:hypothetical protein